MSKFKWEDCANVITMFDKYAKDFNPKTAYRPVKGMETMSSLGMNGEMGKLYNLVTRMHDEKAPKSEMTRAVKYMKVLIFSCDKQLNYKKARTDFRIAELAQKYGFWSYWVY